jgi:hypothetical protein
MAHVLEAAVAAVIPRLFDEVAHESAVAQPVDPPDHISGRRLRLFVVVPQREGSFVER